MYSKLLDAKISIYDHNANAPQCSKMPKNTNKSNSNMQ